MKKVLGVILWVPVLPIKAILFLAGLVLVFPMVKLGKEWKVYQREDKKRPYTYWEMAIRNPVGGFAYLIDHPTHYTQQTKAHGTLPIWTEEKPDDTLLMAYPEPWTLQDLKQKSGWRWRWSKKLYSFRYVRLRGKDRYSEVYIGWKLGSAPPLLDFASSARGWIKPRKVGE